MNCVKPEIFLKQIRIALSSLRSSAFLTQHSTIALKLHFVPSIPLFHVGGIKAVLLKATYFQYVIEIPRGKLFGTSICPGVVERNLHNCFASLEKSCNSAYTHFMWSWITKNNKCLLTCLIFLPPDRDPTYSSSNCGSGFQPRSKRIHPMSVTLWSHE